MRAFLSTLLFLSLSLVGTTPAQADGLEQLSRPSVPVGWLDSGCTGVLIGPDIILTAAYCVYDKGEKTWQGKRFELLRNGDNTPFGGCGLKRRWVFDGWLDDTQFISPLALGAAQLDCDVGRQTGWSSMTTSAQNLGAKIGVTGYAQTLEPHTVWSDAGVLLPAEGLILKYDAETVGGMAGSPLTVVKGGRSLVIGVHGYGSSERAPGFGIPITTEMFEALNRFIDDEAPPGPADPPDPGTVAAVDPPQEAPAEPIESDIHRKITVFLECEAPDRSLRRGTGVIIDGTGHVITAAHLAPSREHSCFGEVGRTVGRPSLKLSVKRISPHYDISLLTFGRREGTPARAARFRADMHRDRVFAFGFPDPSGNGLSDEATVAADEVNTIRDTIPLDGLDMSRVDRMAGAPVIHEGQVIGIIVATDSRNGSPIEWGVLDITAVDREFPGFLSFDD